MNTKNHNHRHDHCEDDRHHHADGLIGRITSLFGLHNHSHDHRELAADQAFRENEEGIHTIWVALAILLFTAVAQMLIVYFSGSVSLFADTAHNIGDGLNSIPLLIAFYLARRIPTRRYTYGFGRAEDVAGILIVISIAISAGIVFYEAFQRLINPQPLSHLGWVAAAAVAGFVGNEVVALLQIRMGNKIGSAAMVADGMHARTDGLTSLAVLVAAAGSWLGYPIVDPIIGLLIGVAILFITRDAMKTIWYRLMDAVDPELIDRAEAVIGENERVLAINRLRLRWVGHCLHAEVYISVCADLKTIESHEIGEQVRHALFHELEVIREITIHIDPWIENIGASHKLTSGHEPVPQLILKN